MKAIASCGLSAASLPRDSCETRRTLIGATNLVFDQAKIAGLQVLPSRHAGPGGLCDIGNDRSTRWGEEQFHLG
jgi:hypothetical protein